VSSTGSFLDPSSATILDTPTLLVREDLLCLLERVELILFLDLSSATILDTPTLLVREDLLCLLERVELILFLDLSSATILDTPTVLVIEDLLCLRLASSKRPCKRSSCNALVRLGAGSVGATVLLFLLNISETFSENVLLNRAKRSWGVPDGRGDSGRNLVKIPGLIRLSLISSLRNLLSHQARPRSVLRDLEVHSRKTSRKYLARTKELLHQRYLPLIVLKRCMKTVCMVVWKKPSVDKVDLL
jgi:hypothetical protein